jgi:hypothetical protein
MEGRIRAVAIVLTAFVAITAIGGGLAILAGADEFPAQWLEGTPFPDYTTPALILTFVVGGSALVAALLLATRSAGGATMTTAAGLLLAVFVTTEVLVLRQQPPGPTPIEIGFLWVALLTAALGAHAMAQTRRARGIPLHGGGPGVFAGAP